MQTVKYITTSHPPTQQIYTKTSLPSSTYDHRLRKTGHPVRSAIHKPQIDRLVVGWVTTSESRLLYVFFGHFLHKLFYQKTIVEMHGYSFFVSKFKLVRFHLVTGGQKWGGRGTKRWCTAIIKGRGGCSGQNGS